VAGLLSGAAAIGCGPTTAPGTTDAPTTSTGGSEGTTATATSLTGGPSTASDTSTTGTTGATPTTSTDPCPTFICLDEGPVLGECDVFAQDCPDGQKCAAVITDGGGAWNSTRCVPVTGTDVRGDPCTVESIPEGLDSCVEGAMCWGVDAMGMGTCVELCKGTLDAPTCPTMGFCTIANGGVLNLCRPNCDPVLQDCTGLDEACYPSNGNFTCVPTSPESTGKANDPCEFINVCEPGLLCADAAQVGAACPMGSTGCCTPFCEFPGGTCPNPDQQCIQWFDPMNLPPEPKGAASIGFCGVPQ
jgi:hypothetical protein